jgi:hypothetical protein
MPASEELLILASRVTAGIVVVLVGEDDVYVGRQLVRDYDNVMFTPADPGGLIPWRDGFFTFIWAPGVAEPTAEMRRVLTENGVILRRRPAP